MVSAAGAAGADAGLAAAAAGAALGAAGFTTGTLPSTTMSFRGHFWAHSVQPMHLL